MQEGGESRTSEFCSHTLPGAIAGCLYLRATAYSPHGHTAVSDPIPRGLTFVIIIVVVVVIVVVSS